MCNKAIVYGTLRPGEPERIIKVKGKMFDLGWYPGIRLDGDAEFVGEVITIESEKHLALLDRYEGYDSNNPSDSLYIRRMIRIDGEDYWIYEYNQDLDELERDGYVLPVESGSWLIHKGHERGYNYHLAIYPEGGPT